MRALAAPHGVALEHLGADGVEFVVLEGITVYLAGDDSAYTTGGLFTVDGGLTVLKGRLVP
jgi:hypothetical protein